MKRFILLILLIISLQNYSQDVIFSQNFLVPETISTSFTGAIRSTKTGSVSRSQWRNSALKTSSNFAFIDTWFEGFKSGLGVSFLNQKESGSSYTFNQVNLNFSMVEVLNDLFHKKNFLNLIFLF